MAKAQGKRGLIVTIVVLGLTLLSVSAVVVWQNLNKDTTPNTTSETSTPAKDEKPVDSKAPETDKVTSTPSAVDPSTLTSIAVEPLGVTVFYSKGTPGFEFNVLRAGDGTKYVEFSSPQLVGTKCTNDTGVFVSIVKSPKSPEDKTLYADTVTVAGTTYGLSLSDSTCTSDAALLETYQSGFKNGFSELEELEV